MAALLDILCNQYEIDTVSSIREHLCRLMNTRAGTLAHMPSYGLPDIGEIYQGLPYSLQHFKMMVAQLIEQYEPRLKQVRILHRLIQDHDTVIHLEINAVIKNNEKILFNTYFVSGGIAVIKE